MKAASPEPPGDPGDGPCRFDVGFRLALLLEPDGVVRTMVDCADLGDTTSAAFVGHSILEMAAQRGSGRDGAAILAERLEACRRSTSRSRGPAVRPS